MTGIEIYNERKKRGWSQSELAKRSGATVTTISRIETNNVKPQPLTVAAIQSAFDKSPTPKAAAI